MRNLDFAPLYRATVGFDRIADLMDRVLTSDVAQPTYPPYNIEKTAEDRGPVTLKEFLDEYVAHRRDVKDSTRKCYRRTVNCLLQFFGPDKRIDEITAGDASKWRRLRAVPDLEETGDE